MIRSRRLIISLALGSLSFLAPLSAQTLDFKAVPTLYPAPTGPAATPPRTGLERVYRQMEDTAIFSVDTEDAIQVRQFYNAVYNATVGLNDMEWTGSYEGAGDPGDISQVWRETSILRLNYYRAMAGVPAWISLDQDFSMLNQAGALMLSGEFFLSHNAEADINGFTFDAQGNVTGNVTQPGTEFWRYYSADASMSVADSNIAIGSSGIDAVKGYMRDHGLNNENVGHRKWILHPPHRNMGWGDVAGQPGLTFSNIVYSQPYPVLDANNNYIFDGNTNEPWPAIREEFVAWPPKGYLPYTLMYPRWSFTINGVGNPFLDEVVDFSQATVTMTRDGESIPVAIDYTPNGQDNAGHLVWVPEGFDTNSVNTLIPAPESVITYDVTINNIFVGGNQRSYNYQVKVFDPDVPAAGEPNYTLAGPTEAVAGEVNAFEFQAPDFLDSLEWRTIQTEAVNTLSNGDSLEDFTATVSGYNPVSGEESGADGSVFKLGHESPATDQLIAYNRELLPGPGAKVAFDSKLGFAQPGQTAHVEVSVDGGIAWASVYAQNGTGSGDTRETTFTRREVDLSSFAGRTISLRFRYTVSNGASFNTGATSGSGWAIDNVALEDVQAVNSISAANPASREAALVTPTDTTPISLQARGIAFGGFPLEWGPVSTVNVRPAGSPLADIAENEWLRSPRLDWINGRGSGWIFGLNYGFLYAEAFPWVYHLDFGWLFYQFRQGDDLVWFYSPSLGGLNLEVYEPDGWFRALSLDGTEVGWDNFLNPSGVLPKPE